MTPTMPPPPDTIAALATPPGRGSVGIVRVSGPAAADIARAVLGRLPPPRRADYRPFLEADGSVIDAGIALFFPAPHSFTGEDVLELQGHGGPVVMDMLLQRAVHLGARLAEPGEFSQRAFLNDKLDLARAEAIADLIDAASRQAARAAVRSLQGEFSTRIHALVEQLTELRAYVEAGIDFPDEEIDLLADGQVADRLERIAETLARTTAGAEQGRLLSEGMHLVIAGRPNAGKSSLLNRLAEREAAIVTAIPGTTRDVLRERIGLDGMPLHVVDTAGLRDSDDPVEQEGMRRAWQEIEQADRLLLVVDDRIGVQSEERAILDRLPHDLPITVLRNKADLTGRIGRSGESDLGTELYLSAKTGAGIDLLRDHLKDCMGYHPAGEGGFMARRRHLEALAGAAGHLRNGRAQLASPTPAGELLAEDLRLAQGALAEITGEFGSDDLLGRIFSGFCIGK